MQSLETKGKAAKSIGKCYIGRCQMTDVLGEVLTNTNYNFLCLQIELTSLSGHGVSRLSFSDRWRNVGTRGPCGEL